MSTQPRPVTNLTILAGVIVASGDGTYMHVTRAPLGYHGPEYVPVPVLCAVGERVCVSYAITPPLLSMRSRLAVGFGCVRVTCDDREVWSGDAEGVRVGMIEALAYSYNHGDHPSWNGNRRRSLEHDWRIHFEAPLGSATYQRQGRRKWVCVEKGMGFA